MGAGPNRGRRLLCPPLHGWHCQHHVHCLTCLPSCGPSLIPGHASGVGVYLALEGYNNHWGSLLAGHGNSGADSCGCDRWLVHKQHLPQFVLSCVRLGELHGRGHLIGSFLQAMVAANAYRGDGEFLLGLLAIHLLLLSMNKVHPDLDGSVEIVLDCVGALTRVLHLLHYRIPSRCRPSDILKTILIHCRSTSFRLCYNHVKAHQR